MFLLLQRSTIHGYHKDSWVWCQCMTGWGFCEAEYSFLSIFLCFFYKDNKSAIIDEWIILYNCQTCSIPAASGRIVGLIRDGQRCQSKYHMTVSHLTSAVAYSRHIQVKQLKSNRFGWLSSFAVRWFTGRISNYLRRNATSIRSDDLCVVGQLNIF